MIKECIVCGKEITTSRINHKYCSGNCKSAYYRANKRKEINAREREKRKLLKIEVLSYYSNGIPECFCCGEKHIEFLTIHHKNGGGRRHLRRENLSGSGIHLYGWIKKHNFPKGFNVLCFNCNCSKGNFGYCPHQKNIQKRSMEKCSVDGVLLTPESIREVQAIMQSSILQRMAKASGIEVYN